MYSFEPNEEQKMLIDVIQRYAQDDLRPAAIEAEASGELAESLVGKGWDLGAIQASIPEQYGGFGEHSSLTNVLALEEVSFGDAAGALAVFNPGLVVYPILFAGSEEQKMSILPRIVERPWQPVSAAVLEPRFDFDLNHPKTVAQPNGDGYVLQGEKVMVPFADRAEHYLVYACIGDEAQAFLVNRGDPGFVIQERQKNLGLNAVPFYRVCFDSVHVAQDQMLGGEQGHTMDKIVASFRLANAAISLGVARAAFEYSRDYALEREVFGVKVAQKQAIAFMLAEMATDLEAARLLTWEAAWQFDQQEREWQKQAYLAELAATEMVMMVTDRAVQILGGHGYIREHPVEMWMRNGRGFSSLTGLAMV